MIGILDAAYAKTASAAACVTARDFTAVQPLSEFTHRDGPAVEYHPGAFWRRELPLFLKVLRMLPERPSVLVVDGYVWLDAHDRKGLGAHLFEALEGNSAVIGVAKTRFDDADKWAARLRRGGSLRSLYITAVGMALDEAVEAIGSMAGRDRTPTLVRLADQNARAALKS